MRGITKQMVLDWIDPQRPIRNTAPPAPIVRLLLQWTNTAGPYKYTALSQVYRSNQPIVKVHLINNCRPTHM